MNIVVAKTTTEIAQCQDVLRKVFVVEHGFDLAIPDQYESQSVYVCAQVDNAVVGALRIIIKKAGGSIPLEDVTDNCTLTDLGTVGEISRMAILPTYRGKTLSRAAYAMCWDLGKQYGLDNFVIEARYAIRSFHKRLGFVESGQPFYDPAMVEPGDAVGEPNAVMMVANVDALCSRNAVVQYAV